MRSYLLRACISSDLGSSRISEPARNLRASARMVTLGAEAFDVVISAGDVD